MQYQITSDNIQMSPSMEVLAKEKVGKLENQLKHLPEDARLIRVVMNKMPDNTFEVKLLITVRGKEYFTDEADYLLETALVKAVDELERMLKKEKVIVSAQEWEQAREAKRATEEDLLDEENLE
ncbi:hypothetical protein GYA27_01395 [candidate division WWE3 bacterium]|uniref:Ribosome-associated translation inhibitor RaiA n=1 Tax=candidate division WWE3 bacterium TaxID=2053526 RepID=A0A7X9DKC2_UNCKA|nr:hypothetical protein [candidate division WWE3 bacterium]